MKTIIDLVLLTLIVIYIVDLSGFTETWLTFLSAYKKRKILEFKPFSCSLCMVWWCGLGYALLVGKFTLPVVAFVGLLSFLSVPLGQILVLIREFLNNAIDVLMDLISL